MARYIHDVSSRARGPFIAINCGAISPQLLESELFGYEAGAFTGAHPKGYPGKLRLAHKGTIFLDEIGEMREDMQVALLRFLQEKTIRPIGSNQEHHVDARVITATHRDLRQLVREGKFREDLFYRIHVLPIELPPLRERIEDLPALIDHFMGEMDVKRRLSPEAMEILQFYRWPGNIRELKNVLLSASLFAKGDVIQPDDIRRVWSRMDWKSPVHPKKTNLVQEVRQDRAREIRQALQRTGGNISQAARMLGVSRSTLYRWMKQIATVPETL